MMVGMWLVNPINAVLSTQKTFTELAGPGKVDLTMAKLVFVGLNLCLLAVALYKLSTLGLLPITAADWVRFVSRVYGESFIRRRPPFSANPTLHLYLS